MTDGGLVGITAAAAAGRSELCGSGGSSLHGCSTTTAASTAAAATTAAAASTAGSGRRCLAAPRGSGCCSSRPSRSTIAVGHCHDNRRSPTAAAAGSSGLIKLYDFNHIHSLGVTGTVADAPSLLLSQHPKPFCSSSGSPKPTPTPAAAATWRPSGLSQSTAAGGRQFGVSGGRCCRRGFKPRFRCGSSTAAATTTSSTTAAAAAAAAAAATTTATATASTRNGAGPSRCFRRRSTQSSAVCECPRSPFRERSAWNVLSSAISLVSAAAAAQINIEPCACRTVDQEEC
jgi:hypothetical protein